MVLRHVLRTQRVSIDCGFEVFSDPDIHMRNVNTINMMTKGFSKRGTVLRLQPFVVKPPLVLPASFSAMSGTANFLPEAQQAPSGRGETHARAVEAGVFDQQSAAKTVTSASTSMLLFAISSRRTILASSETSVVLLI